jgi:hypothetical protein
MLLCYSGAFASLPCTRIVSCALTRMLPTDTCTFYSDRTLCIPCILQSTARQTTLLPRSGPSIQQNLLFGTARWTDGLIGLVLRSLERCYESVRADSRTGHVALARDCVMAWLPYIHATHATHSRCRSDPQHTYVPGAVTVEYSTKIDRSIEAKRSEARRRDQQFVPPARDGVHAVVDCCAGPGGHGGVMD